MKCRGLGIPYPQLYEERTYNTSKAASDVLVVSLLGGIDLNYVAHKGYVRRASHNRWKQRDIAEKAMFLIRKDIADGAGLNRLQQAMDNWAYLTAIPHRLNGMELSWEEFQDNLLLRYGIVPLNLPTDCDGCGKKFSVPHNLSCPKWAFLCHGTMMPLRNGDLCRPGPLTLALYPTNLKSTVGQYRERGTGADCGSRWENRRGGGGQDV